MVQKLYQDFLESPDRYRACETYWEQLVDDVSKSLNQQGEWKRWIPRHFADGSPFEMDGNPIFDGRSQKLSRAFRIMQHPPVGDEIEIAAWLKAYEEEFADLPREELVLNLSLSEESAQLARELLGKWMKTSTTVDEMNQFIRELLAK